MPVEIDADGVRRLMSEEGALLLEVLPEDEYREEHLPGAMNIPGTKENVSPRVTVATLSSRGS